MINTNRLIFRMGQGDKPPIVVPFTLEEERAREVGLAARPDPSHRDLTPAEFEGMLSASELDRVWTMIENSLKNQTDTESRGVRRQLTLMRKKTWYTLADTLAMIASFRVRVAIIDSDIDLTDRRIISEWEEAVQEGNDNL